MTKDNNGQTQLSTQVEAEICEMHRVGMAKKKHMEAAIKLLRAEPDLDQAYPGAKVSEIAELLLDLARVQ